MPLLRAALAFAVSAVILSCDDAPTPPDPPPATAPPQILAIAPDTVEVSSSEIAITVTGTGFGEGSAVYIETPTGIVTALPTTRDSDTRLQARIPPVLLSEPGVLLVWAESPAPVPGTTDRIPLVVGPGQPLITDFYPRRLLAGLSTSLFLQGQGFTPTSQIVIDGRPAATVFQNARLVSVETLVPSELIPGSIEVAVVTPGAGGGTSALLRVPIDPGSDLIQGYFPRVLTVGEPTTTTLILRGGPYEPDARILWNGEERPTTVGAPDQAWTVLSAADQARRQFASVQIRNPVAGVTSRTLVLPIADAFQPPEHELLLRNHDLIHDPISSTILVSTRSDETDIPRALVAIDPDRGVVLWSLALEGEPGTLALSSDGSTVHVADVNLPRIWQVDLGTRTVTDTWELPAGLVVEDMVALPGPARRVALTLRDPCCVPSHRGVFIYENGAALPDSVVLPFGPNRIFLAPDGVTLWGHHRETAWLGVHRLTLTPSGVRHVSVVTERFGSIGAETSFGGDVLVDAVGNTIRLPSLALGPTLTKEGIVLADPPSRRVHLLVRAGSNPGGFFTYDLDTGALIAFTHMGRENTAKAIKIDTDRIAIGRGNWIVVSRSPFYGTGT